MPVWQRYRGRRDGVARAGREPGGLTITAATFLWLLLSYGALGAATLYALRCGGAPERLGGAAFLGGAVLSWLVVPHHGAGFRQLELPLASVDLGTGAVFLFLAMFANRWWPLCATTIQTYACLSHLTKMIDPTFPAAAYARMESSSAWPLVVILGCSTLFHRRRTIRSGVDPSWNRFLPPRVCRALARLRLG